MAAPIVVLNDGEHRDLIISNGEYFVQALTPALNIVPYLPGLEPTNALYMNFFYDDADIVQGGIAANPLPFFPSHPLQTLCILATGGLRLEGMTIDRGGSFVEPSFDPFGGDIRPAAITHGTGPFSAFNLLTFAGGDMAYIGYASSDKSIFGYMQIQRVNVTDWRLIGYSYDPSGTGIVVTALPAPPAALGVLGAALLNRPRRCGAL
ncbi:MAG: hypothetical protein KF902_15045 [Phycisphaeraceae bacterium]|nr:hypothetical protein [Phycisphaeraceae bacterium]